MAVYKRGDKYGIDYYYQGKRIRKIVGTSKKQAEIVDGKIMAEIAEGKYLDVQKSVKETLPNFLQLYLQDYSCINNKPSTHYRNIKISENLVAYYGNIQLKNINDLSVEKYKKYRIKQGLKLSTINRELAFLKAVLNKAKQWNKLQTPLPIIKLFKVDNARIRYLTDEEYDILLEVSPEILKPKIIIAVHTGMRIGELVSLKWQDVDMKQQVITVRDTKSKENRHIAMNSVVIDCMMHLQETSVGEYVFEGKTFNSHISASYISHLFSRIAKKTGVTNCTFHDLRHTFASWLVMREVNLKTVQELLGHKDFKMTLRHAHLSPEHKKRAARCLINISI